MKESYCFILSKEEIFVIFLNLLTYKVKLIGSTTIENTPQKIACNLHTSRVVVSHLLKKLEK